jgi:cobalt-zinc-cadmium efflux system protein
MLSQSDHHEHSHGHHSSIEFRDVNNSFVIAVCLNLIFTGIEATFALITGSASLLADAGHNLSDVLGLLLAWAAAYLATRGTSNLYSYGYRRTTILAAVTNAIVLMFAAAFIAFQSIEKIFNPARASELIIMVVAGLGILINAGSAMLFMSSRKNDLNMKGAYLHLAYDALISMGVVVAALAMYLTGLLWLDGAVGLLIVLIIVWGTWGLLMDSVNMILDAVPQHVDRDEVKKYLMDIVGVSEVHDLHIWALSTNETCLTAHLVMPENTLWDSATGYSDICKELNEYFRIQHVTLQVEKDFECVTQDCN